MLSFGLFFAVLAGGVGIVNVIQITMTLHDFTRLEIYAHTTPRDEEHANQLKESYQKAKQASLSRRRQISASMIVSRCSGILAAVLFLISGYLALTT